MHGLSSSAVKYKLNKVDLSDLTVKEISRTLELSHADGVEAGLFLCTPNLFDKLDELADGRAYFALADAMQLYAGEGALRPVDTKGLVWFGVENREALEYAISDGMKEIGVVQEDYNWLEEGAFSPDGEPLRVRRISTGKAQDDRPQGGTNWADFSVERWRSAVYINMSYFGDLYTDTCDFVCEIAKHMKLRGERVSLCEVGCGTGEFIRPLAEHFRTVVGVDFNDKFIEFCNSNLPKGKEDKVKFVHGDACELVQLMQRKAPARFQADTKIVCCVGNTMGIIPDALKPKIYQQMTELAGPNGVVVIVYWNARHFGDACQNFYHANPQLCGSFEGSAIDFDNCTLTTASYRTKWTSIAEARANLVTHGLEELIVEEKGKGVLVAARMK
jgi:SAM-dependent methyltransferase